MMDGSSQIQRRLYIVAIVVGPLELARGVYLKLNAKSVEHSNNFNGFVFRSVVVVMLCVIA